MLAKLFACALHIDALPTKPPAPHWRLLLFAILRFHITAVTVAATK
jgi:hypothetical protein